MEDRLEVIALARVLRIEQLHELEAESLVDVLLRRLGVDLGAHDEAQEEFVRDLQVRPCRLQDRLVLLRIEVVGGGGEGAAHVRGDHCHEVGHDRFGEDLLAGGGVDVVDELQQRLTFHVLPALVGGGIVEREDDPAKLKLQFEQLLPLVGRRVPQRRQFPQRRRGAPHLRQALIRRHRRRRIVVVVGAATAAGCSIRAERRGGVEILRHGLLRGLGDGEGLAILALGRHVQRGRGLGGGGRGGRGRCLALLPFILSAPLGFTDYAPHGLIIIMVIY
mmetsp:Transcript_15534/g.37261  ORF Transcript_15534/g.37261 Transcript_15534/m.37261 type:complete len:277 (+) Transcript_15534:1021-1851(+)